MGSTKSRAGWVVAAVSLIALAVSASSASAITVKSFNVEPSTTQAAGHPDVKISVGFDTGLGEDLRDLTLDFPPGLIGNPEERTKCSRSRFNSDGCTSASAVGTTTVVATALGIPLPVPGTVYLLQPEAADAATLGIVLRPTGGLPIVGKIFAVAHVTAVRNADGDYFLRNTLTNLPSTARGLGLLPVPITIQSMTLNLKRTGNTSSTYFLTNPTGCQAAVSRVQAVSDTNSTANAQASYTPTGCASVPFSPAFDFQTTTTQAGARTAPTATITVPAGEHPLRQSHVKSVQLRFPPGMTLDILTAFGVDVCSDAAFAADSCGAGSHLGNAKAAVPPLPPDFTGDVYRVAAPAGELYGFGVVLRGPRGVKATMRGGASITSAPTPEGVAVQLVATFNGLPQIPFTKFELALTNALFFNPPVCVDRSPQAVIGGWSGASATVSDPYASTGC
jgi:hypothetical protein